MSKTCMLGSFLVVAAVAMANHAVEAATVDFESLPPGTQFGGAPLPNAPGDLVFTENGVGVHVDNFTLGAFVGFNNVEIGGFTDPFVSDHAGNDQQHSPRLRHQRTGPCVGRCV